MRAILKIPPWKGREVEVLEQCQGPAWPAFMVRMPNGGVGIFFKEELDFLPEVADGTDDDPGP